MVVYSKCLTTMGQLLSLISVTWQRHFFILLARKHATEVRSTLEVACLVGVRTVVYTCWKEEVMGVSSSAPQGDHFLYFGIKKGLRSSGAPS